MGAADHGALASGRFLIDAGLQQLAVAMAADAQRPQVERLILLGGLVLLAGQLILGAEGQVDRRLRQVQPDVGTVIRTGQCRGADGRAAEVDLALAGADPRAAQAGLPDTCRLTPRVPLMPEASATLSLL